MREKERGVIANTFHNSITFLANQIATLVALAIDGFLQANLHRGRVVIRHSDTIRIVTMGQLQLALPQERLPTAVALFEEPGGGNDRRLHLAVALAFALVHRYISVAGPVEATQLIVLLCKLERSVRSTLNEPTRLDNDRKPFIRWISDGRVSQVSSPG